MRIPFLQKQTDYGTYSYIEYFCYLTKHFFRSNRRFAELHNIMRKEQLTTYFQPIMDIQTGSCLGYEILNRPPFSEWFPNTDAFYEYIGTTNQVFAFELLCRELSVKRYCEALQHSSMFEGCNVFLNVHPDVLRDTNHRSGETIRHLQRYGLKPEQIVFELTEKQAVEDFEAFKHVLSSYREQGFRIAIDDVGSGYSSLKSIVSLNPEFIKLDRSLVQHIDSRPDQQHVVKMLQEFAKSSGTFVIAEGIERLEELMFLQQQRISYGQGYALGRPSIALTHQIIEQIVGQIQPQQRKATNM
ncbi:EAL domain-containing protein [Paenibacillus campi]|uniref:EAL domain-containing protein n=1 Tax=Paenibacillus campi TaxID=3106031 RepID=UPI002AFE639A|nr:EAL domain-containing protein [Paenibacillus sp. SGZ-1009]